MKAVTGFEDPPLCHAPIEPPGVDRTKVETVEAMTRRQQSEGTVTERCDIAACVAVKHWQGFGGPVTSSHPGVPTLKHTPPRADLRIPSGVPDRRATSEDLSGSCSILVGNTHLDTIGESEFRASPSGVVSGYEDVDPMTSEDGPDQFGIWSVVGGVHDGPGHSGSSSHIILLDAVGRNRRLSAPG